MEQEFEFQELTFEEKKVLLAAYNYDVDNDGIIIDSLLNEPIRSNTTGKPLTINNAAFISGSLKIIDSDPLTLARFLREKIEHGS
ncbi:MAG TPA: hypothetical protein VJI75_05755 [Candidatus Nanoarchaeia archaeon]|nr:hypothetical protein [Candidatus Nanoarchaeia archaeon]